MSTESLQEKLNKIKRSNTEEIKSKVSNQNSIDYKIDMMRESDYKSSLNSQWTIDEYLKIKRVFHHFRLSTKEFIMKSIDELLLKEGLSIEDLTPMSDYEVEKIFKKSENLRKKRLQ